MRGLIPPVLLPSVKFFGVKMFDERQLELPRDFEP